MSCHRHCDNLFVSWGHGPSGPVSSASPHRPDSVLCCTGHAIVDAVVVAQSCTADTRCCRQQVPSGIWLLLVQHRSPWQSGERIEGSGTRASGTRSGMRCQNRSGKPSRMLLRHDNELQGDALSTTPFSARRAASCQTPPNVLLSVGASVRPRDGATPH